MEPEVERQADSRLQTSVFREDISPSSPHLAHVLHSLSDAPSTRLPGCRRKAQLQFSGWLGARQDCHACRGGQAFTPCEACSCEFSKELCKLQECTHTACAYLDTLPLYLLAGALGLWVVLCDGVLREGFSFLCLAQQASCAWRVSGIVSIMLVISCFATTSNVRLLGTRVATAQDEEGEGMRGVAAGEAMRWHKMHRTMYNGRVALGTTVRARACAVAVSCIAKGFL